MKLLKNKMSNKHSNYFFDLLKKYLKKKWTVDDFHGLSEQEFTLTRAIVNSKPAEKYPQMSFAARENYKEITFTSNSNKTLRQSVQSPP